MRGQRERQQAMFVAFNVEERVPADHPLREVKRRTRTAGLGDRFSNHTFKGTGITAYLSNDGALERAQYMAGHASPQDDDAVRSTRPGGDAR